MKEKYLDRDLLIHILKESQSSRSDFRLIEGEVEKILYEKSSIRFVSSFDDAGKEIDLKERILLIKQGLNSIVNNILSIQNTIDKSIIDSIDSEQIYNKNMGL